MLYLNDLEHKDESKMQSGWYKAGSLNHMFVCTYTRKPTAISIDSNCREKDVSRREVSKRALFTIDSR